MGIDFSKEYRALAHDLHADADPDWPTDDEVVGWLRWLWTQRAGATWEDAYMSEPMDYHAALFVLAWLAAYECRCPADYPDPAQVSVDQMLAALDDRVRDTFFETVKRVLLRHLKSQ